MAEFSLEVLDVSHDQVQTSQRTLSSRRSIIATFRSENGDVSGEATPLSGFGSDDVELALEELSEVDADLIARCAGAVAGTFDHSTQGLLIDDDSPVALVGSQSARFTSPSARFCFEVLVLGAAARVRGLPLGRLLTADWSDSTLSTSAVVDSSVPNWQEQLEAQVECGIKTFKVKCGIDPERERSVVDVIARHSELLHYRLDPNAAWSLDQARSFLASIDRTRLEWVEDPTPEPGEWPALRGLAPVAIDEALLVDQVGGGTIELPEVVILKPMALGGVWSSLCWAQRAKASGLLVCVSHFFDGPVAMDAYIHLAFAIQSRFIAPGLGRHLALKAYPGGAHSLPHLGDAEIQRPD